MLWVFLKQYFDSFSFSKENLSKKNPCGLARIISLVKNIFCLTLESWTHCILFTSYELFLANLEKRSSRLTWKCCTLAVLNQTMLLEWEYCSSTAGKRLVSEMTFFNVLFLWCLNRTWRNSYYPSPFLSHTITSELARFCVSTGWFSCLCYVQQHHQQTARSSASHELPKDGSRGDSASCKRSLRIFSCDTLTLVKFPWSTEPTLFSIVFLNHNHISWLRKSTACFKRVWVGEYIYSYLLV